MRIIFTDSFGNGPVLVPDFSVEPQQEEETMEEELLDEKPSLDETIKGFGLDK